MKVLIVEDDIRNVEHLKAILIPKFGENDLVFTASRDGALEAIKAHTFDLVILDRRIPTAKDAFDEDVAHGEQVYAYIRSEVPGTPIRFWTALSDDDYWNEKASDIVQENIWGSGEVHTVGFISKARPEKIEAEIEGVRSALAALDQVVLNQPPGREVELSEMEVRILKVFAKRLNGDTVEVVQLTGGLSGAKVVRATVSRNGNTTHLTVGKLTGLKELQKEHERFQNVLRLYPGVFPNIVLQVRAGAGSQGGIFYRLAEKHEQSFFSLLKEDASAGARVVEIVKGSLATWFSTSERKKSTIGDARRQFADDTVFQLANHALPNLELDRFEALEFSWNACYCHGDLHGENMLCNGANPPMIIDYRDLGISLAARDPITLELSPIFHPSGVKLLKDWPTTEQAKSWTDLSKYLKDCPYPDFVRACRNWAYDWGPGNPALFATAYSCLVRQFKYDDTNKNLAAAMIESIVIAYRKL